LDEKLRSFYKFQINFVYVGKKVTYKRKMSKNDYKISKETNSYIINGRGNNGFGSN
jgi:hypothetical protein